METTSDLYERARQSAGCATHYAFAKRFAVTQQTISGWRAGRYSFDDDHAALIAGILRLEPGYVMACCHAERAKTDKSRSNWVRIAAMLAAVALPPSAGAALSSNANAGAGLAASLTANYAKYRRYLLGEVPRMA